MSYDTIIFQDCAHCEYVSFDARYYSKTTSTLQQAIAHAYNLTEQWNANAQERKESRRIIYQQKRQR